MAVSTIADTYFFFILSLPFLTLPGGGIVPIKKSSRKNNGRRYGEALHPPDFVLKHIYAMRFHRILLYFGYIFYNFFFISITLNVYDVCKNFS